MYITNSEYANQYGGMSFGGITSRKVAHTFKRLPFHSCALSLQPFKEPLCTKDGIVFDKANIIPYIKKHGRNPVTGEALTVDDLFPLHFSKNADGEYQCPVSLRVFNDNTHIVAIRPSGNVFAYEAVEQFNIKAKFWQDLVDDTPFKRKDVVTIQDPHNLEQRNFETFHHIKHKQGLDKDAVTETINQSSATQRVMQELQSKQEPAAVVPTPTRAITKTPANAVVSSYSTGKMAASLTSTVMDPVTSMERIYVDQNLPMYNAIKKNAQIQLTTNYGVMTFELYAKLVPKTCHNYVLLCKSGYYNGTIFHRNVKGFVIQGGDPTGTGKGGESAWGKDFEDEFKQNLLHDTRGILSMANRGPNTNSSQFFITYGECKHLNRKHTVFGKMTSGDECLRDLERIPVDDGEKPLTDIIIEEAKVVYDPFGEYEQRQERKRQHMEHAQSAAGQLEASTTWFGTRVKSTAQPAKIGRYMKQTEDHAVKKTKLH